MIITVTMNPAIDKTAEIKQLERGNLNRLQNCLWDIGGKGINVSKTIKAMGGESIATGFCGGGTGRQIEESLAKFGIESDFVPIKDETRVNLKIVEENGMVTELNEPGPVVTSKELEELTQKLIHYANDEAIFVFAGSIPRGIENDIYQTLIPLVKEKGAKVFLDADAELFAKGMEGKPDYIKPNRIELEEYFGKDYRVTQEELLDMGKELLLKGSSLVAISLGQMGALFLTNERVIKCPGIKVKAHSTVGAGDAMVAGLVYSLSKGVELVECVKLAVAVSAGAVTTHGTKPPSKELIEELKQMIEVIEL